MSITDNIIKNPSRLGFNVVKQLRIGGTTDTVGLSMMVLPFFLNLPGLFAPLAGGYGYASAALLSAIGSRVFGGKLVKALLDDRSFGSALEIHSSPQPVLDDDDLGFNLGVIVDTGKPLIVSTDSFMRHSAIVGTTGVGKTVLGEYIMDQQMARGGSVIFSDGKLSQEGCDKFYQLCVKNGREQDFRVINPGNSAFSNTYNPILDGDPDEVADRLVSLIPSTESDAGSDHFKQAAKQGCTVLITAIQALGLAYEFMDLVILLSNEEELIDLEKQLRERVVLNRKESWRTEQKNGKKIPDAEMALTQLHIFLNQYRVKNKDGIEGIDIKRLKETFGGIGGRLFTFGSDSFGRVLGVTNPEISLFDDIRAGKLIYVMLPTMGKGQTASNFGKMFLGDLRTAISWLQALPDDQKTKIPTLVFMDEFGATATELMARPFEQARSARVILLPAFQTYSNLEAVSLDFAQMVLGNTWVKCFFKVASDATAEAIADSIGLEMKVQNSISVSGGEGASNTASGGMANQGKSDNESIGYSERAMEGYRVSKEDIKALAKGEMIVTVGGCDVYHVRVPLIKFSPDFIRKYPTARLNSPSRLPVKGINLMKKQRDGSQKIRHASDAPAAKKI